MIRSLGKDAYAAARKQTTQKLSLMKNAFIALAKENSTIIVTQEHISDIDAAKSNKNAE